MGFVLLASCESKQMVNGLHSYSTEALMQGATSSGTMTICAQARDKTKGLPISDQLLHPLSHRSGFVASLFLFLWRFKADPLLLVCSSPLAISAQANYQVLLLCSTLNKPKSTDKETNVKLS